MLEIVLYVVCCVGHLEPRFSTLIDLLRDAFYLKKILTAHHQKCHKKVADIFAESSWSFSVVQMAAGERTGLLYFRPSNRRAFNSAFQRWCKWTNIFAQMKWQWGGMEFDWLARPLHSAEVMVLYPALSSLCGVCMFSPLSDPAYLSDYRESPVAESSFKGSKLPLSLTSSNAVTGGDGDFPKLAWERLV